MGAFWPMLKNVLLFVLLAVPGYILVKTKALKEEQSGVLSKILMYVGMPFLIISGTLGIEFNNDTVIGLITAALISVGTIFALYYISLLLTKKVSKTEGEFELKKRGIMRFAEIFSNNGFLGLPLALAIGVDATVFAYLVVINIITNVMLYTLGIYLVSADKNTINVKSILLNPVLIGFIVGIIINLTGLVTTIPEIATFSDHFKNLVTPISMLILGMKMGGIKFSVLFTSKKLYLVSAVKLILVPAFAVLVTYLLSFIIGFNKLFMIEAMFIAFAMPTAGLATAFSDRYNGDTENAVIFTLGTTILSVATIPVLYYLLNLVIS